MPFANEHACRLHDPAGYTRFRRQNGIGILEGKRLDAIIGFKKEGGSEVQSFRYPLSEDWTVSQARAHCREHEGTFEAAEGETTLSFYNEILAVEKEIRERETKALDAYKRGLADAPVLYRSQGFIKATLADGMVFVASEESEDRVGDVITVAGWEVKEFERNPVYLFGHDHSIPPIGTVPKVWVEGKQLLNMVRFDTGDEFAKHIQGKYERGIMRAQSVGFRALEWEERQGTKRGYLFKKQELVEISAVAVPAHPAALRKAVKGWLDYYAISQSDPEVLDELGLQEKDLLTYARGLGYIKKGE